LAFDKPIVLAVNTRYSRLSRIDGYFNFTPISPPPFVTEFAGDDRCHLNGMALHDGKVGYATTQPARRMEVPSGRIVSQACRCCIRRA
jgi:uncharacterized protein (TIGR03032 family)